MCCAAGDTPYAVEAKIGKDSYMFYLNVCGETRGGQCTDEKGYVSSCQIKDGESVTKIAGRFQNQTLRWAESYSHELRAMHRNSGIALVCRRSEVL